MSNLVPFAQAPLPAHFAALPPEASNIAAKTTVPGLSFRGKAWRISIDDNETLITNRDGEPASTVSVIILDQVKARSRVYHEGQYVAGENKAPRCSSVDGVKPDADIKEPCAATCATCPNSVKGSKITPQNKPTTLCSPTKRVAVIPTSKLQFSALLLRLAQTSIWDKDTENEEWKTWDQYMDYLRASGATNTAQVVTKIKFDHRVEYPKLLFKAERWCTPEEWAVVSQRWNSEEVQDLLLGAHNAAAAGGDDGYTPAPTAAAAPAPVQQAAQQPAAAAAPAATPAPTRTRRPRAETAAQAPAQQAPVQQAPVQQAAQTMVDDDDDGGNFDIPATAAQPAQAAQQPATAAAAPVQQAAAQAPAATNNAGLSSLLGAWDD